MLLVFALLSDDSMRKEYRETLLANIFNNSWAINLQ